MDERMPLAVALLTLLLALGLVGWGLHCGARTVGGAEPGEPRGEPSCTAYVSPGIWVALGGAGFGVASVAVGRWTWTMAIGVLVALVGVPFMLSTGVFVLGVGALITVAGLLQRLAGEPDESAS